MKRRSAAWVLLAVLVAIGLFQLSLFSVGVKEFRFPPSREVIIADAPGERFVSLRISWLRQVMYADGKDGLFRTTYDGPVELVTQTDQGIVTRRAWGVQLSGYATRGSTPKKPLTIRLK